MKYTMRSASVGRIFFCFEEETESRGKMLSALPTTSHKKSLPLNSDLDILA